MKQSYFTSPGFTFRLQPFGTSSALFLLFFLLNFTFGFGQGVTISSEEPNPTQNNPIGISIEFDERINGFEESDINVSEGFLSNFHIEWPDFEYTDVSKRLKDFEITINLNPFSGSTDFSPSSNSVIAIDIDESGFIYALTLDEGVFQYNPNGNLTSNNPLISADKFTEPRDLAIDDTGNIFIADSGADQVLKFDNDGGNMQVINSGLSSPSGLAVGPNQRIYVADTENNRVAIFNNNGTVAGEIDNGTGPEGLINPIRLAVDNIFNVYVTDAGNNRIQIYDSNGNHTGSLAGNSGNLNNPGSLVVDDYGFLYVSDIAGVSLNTFLDFENISEGEIIDLALNLGNMRIQVFRTDNLNEEPKTINDAINIPVDLALKPCGYLAVNNSDAIITNFPEVKFIFDLKTYEILPTKFTAALEINAECIPAEVRIDGEVGVDANCNSISASDEFSRIWDQTKPQIQTCYQEDQTVEMGDEIPNYGEEGLVVFEENCEGTLDFDQTPAPGTEISQQTTTVKITATDEAGNISDVCSFDLVIEDNTPDTPPEFVNCPQEIIEIANDPGECGAILDFETPEAIDDNGNPTVTQISGPENGDFINVENGTVELVFQADDGVNDPVNCTVQIKIIDSENPVISDCPPENIEFTIQEGETYPLPDYTEQVTVEDNCDTGLEPVQDPPAGTPIDEDQVVTLTATDEAGNVSNVCSFTVKINVEETYEFQCIEVYTVRLGEGAQNSGVEEIPTSEFITSDTSNLDFELTNQQFTCEDIGTNPLTIRATNKTTGEEYDCTVNVTVQDVGAPLIICPAEPITINLPEEGYRVEDFFENRISDNCNNIEDLVLVQDVEPGTILDEAGTYTINLTATDSYDNEEICRITLILEDDDPDAPEIECVTHELFLDQNGQVTLNPEDILDGEQGNLELSVDIENFDCSNLGENTVILTATDPDTGLSDTCVTEVMISDDILPVANCVAPGREFRLENGSVTISPSAIDLNSEDNCELTRTLSEDTFTIPGTKNIILYVEDAAGNTDQCTTTIEILPEDTNRVYRCIEEEDIPDIRLDEDCGLNIPDYTRLIETENFNAAITQTYEALTEDTYLITVEIRDDDTGEFVGECEFSVNIVDLIPPGISCPNDQIENFDPDTGFEVPNYENMAGISDNCGEVSFRQEPAAGEIIYNNTTVNLFVEDEGGLEASCSFELELTEADVLNISCLIDKNVNPDDNCSFWLPDYTSNADVNFPGANITQTPPVGTILTESTQIKLTASLNGETDECYFMVNLVDDQDPVANCVSGYVVNLDNNGTASITPEDLDNNSTDNCGIVSMALSQVDFTTADIGDVPVTLTVRDDAGNIDSCETTVEVRGEASGEFECRENIEVFLDENGEANLNIQELYTGDASGLNLEASRLNFTCEDLGAAFIQLDYSGDEIGSCTINVDVRDELPPEINTNLVELTLDIEGFAYLEESDISAEDNCSEELIYRFSKSVFTCKDVGMNSVNLEVEDINGNRSDKNIQVRISGEGCDLPEPGENEYLFLYPNPNNGIFTIATPEGMFIEQVRVFDSRGRYIMQQDYNANARFYRMIIQGVEESVYTLQIFTNEGVIVKRAIIKR